MAATRSKPLLGQSVSLLETPAAIIDLNVVDANLAAMRARVPERVQIRTHFKSLKCSGLATYLSDRGFDKFMAAKLCEAETLADAGIRDILIGNEIVGDQKIRRLVNLAERCQIAVCVDAAQNVAELSEAACRAGASLGVFVEVDVGQARCGVATAGEAVRLALQVLDHPGLEFLGLQGYDGQNQHVLDSAARRKGCLAALERLIEFRNSLDAAGVSPRVVSTAGTGTSEIAASFPGITEIQPGSYVLMDCHYRKIAPQFDCALSVLTTVISRRGDSHCVLDAGYKSISKDYELGILKDQSLGQVSSMSEEHTKVERPAATLRIGSHVEVIPSHCCGTVNLHRQCVASRAGRIEAVWPIEAAGRYD